MPRWVVHENLGEFCGISRNLMHEVNRFIDLGLDHDGGRLIVYGHWDPYELYRMASKVYEMYGSEGVKVALHHHLMDYVCSLLTKLKYGALVRHIVGEIKRVGFATVYEDVNTGQVYTSPLVRGFLRTISLKREEAIEFVYSKVKDMVDNVLNLLSKDFFKQRDEVEKILHNLSRDMKKCIEESAKKLVYTYTTSLLNESRENPWRSIRSRGRLQARR